MGFHNVVLPSKFFRYGSTTGPSHETIEPVDSDSGVSGRFARWQNSRRIFRINADSLTRIESAELLAFVVARQGSTHSFLIEDPSDHSTATDHIGTPADTDSRITDAIGADPSQLTFQLVKRYGDATTGFVRTLRRIKQGTVVIEKDETTPLVEGTDFVVDHFLGHVLVPAGSASRMTAGCEYYLKVRFADNTDKQAAVVLDDFDICATAFGMIEDQVEEVVVIGDNPKRERDIDRVFCLDERTTTGGGVVTFEPIPSGGWKLGFDDGRHVVLYSTIDVDVYLPGIFGIVPSEIMPGGPVMTITNMGDKTFRVREYTNAAKTTSALIDTRPNLRGHQTREFFVDSNGKWRGV